jgi:hypothetical protein
MKKYVFFFFLSRESRVCFRESRPCLTETEKNTFSVFFSFTRVMVLLARKGRLCFSESHDRASRKRKKTRFLFFFLSRESRFCFRERHGCAFARVTNVPPRKQKKNAFSLFFSSARGTVVISWEARACLFRKGKKPVLPVRFFRPVFSWKKNSSKPINKGSNFEDLDARNLTVKAVRDLDARFER